MQESNLVPVFVSPKTLSFYVNDSSTHKQVLTLYNPYAHFVRFQVLCSSRDENKYSVVDPEVKVKSRSNIDIVIRHNSVTHQNIGQTDKFRIQMFKLPVNKLIGQKDVTAVVLAGKTENSPEKEINDSASVHSLDQQPILRRQVRPGDLNPLVVIVVIICILILLLPTQGEPSSFLSDYLKPTVNLKLAVAYVLGLLTMKVLTPV